MPKRSIGRYLVWAFIACLCGHYIKKVISKPRDPNEKHRDSRCPSPNVRRLPDPPQDKHPSEGEHRTAEQLYWRKSIIATWIAVLVAGGAAVFSYEAFQEARRQADAAEQSNRPWLSIKSASVSKLTVTKLDVGMLIDLTITNFGNAPAVRVFAQGIVRRQNETLDNYDFFDESRQYCRAVNYPENYLGLVGIPNKDIRFVARASRTLNDLGATMPDKEDGSSGLADYLKETGLHVVGCVIYQGANTTIHRSSFDFYIGDFDVGRKGVTERVVPRFDRDGPVYAD